MDRHALFFDIDGTLFDCAHGLKHVTDELKNAIKQLKDNGHLCFVASGRPYGYLTKEIRELGFNGFVLCNGAAVMMDNQILLTHYIHQKDVIEIVGALNQMDAMYCLNDVLISYCPKKFKTMYDLLESFEVPLEYISSDYDLGEVNIAKMEVHCYDDSSCQYIRELKQQNFEVLEYFGANMFEINLGHVSKGKTILEVLNKLNIPVQNSIAFGDGDNDIEMLKVVGHGVAMGNALPSVKKVADTVTESCVDGGIVKELKRLHLIGEE